MRKDKNVPTNESPQSSFTFDEAWPPYEQFPHNCEGRMAIHQWREDLSASSACRIITGYTSLDMLVQEIADWYAPGQNRTMQLLLGHVPRPEIHRSTASSRIDFTQEIREYWLNAGISIYYSAKVIKTLQALDSGKIEARISAKPYRPVHAKIYDFDQAVWLGSSNFSRAGLEWQVEANYRFSDTADVSFDRAKQLSDAVWWEGVGYLSELKQLLRDLLHEVSWQEAIARACAEVLEGRETKRFLSHNGPWEAPPRWPSQDQGIVQALWVLDTFGCVLIADATGSGKTRMGAGLMRCLLDRARTSSRLRNDKMVLLAPSEVLKMDWERECNLVQASVHVCGHGSLSQKQSGYHEIAMSAVQRAQFLAIDEAHRFMNPDSNRTQAIYQNNADNVILFTATPFSKGIEDTIGLIYMLGIDNFEDDFLQRVEDASKAKNRGEKLSDEMEAELSNQLFRFMVRRVKGEFNRLIDEDPSRYTNRLGNRCRYPKHNSLFYYCDESDADRKIAKAIKSAASKLRGLINLQEPLRMTERLLTFGITERQYLATRLASAKGLAKYRIDESLRSSNAALLEHICGREAAAAGFRGKPPSASTMLGAISKLKDIAGNVLASELEIDGIDPWLVNEDAHRTACEEEIQIYEEILVFLSRLSTTREEKKVKLLLELYHEKKLVLAFDHHIITLYDIQERLRREGMEDIVVATSAVPHSKKEVCSKFGLGATWSGIGLCSDSLSESVNLQQCNAIVNLDTPPVIITAEQRIGRVDRMDSPHSDVFIYWACDAEEFKLKADTVFLNRHAFVARMIGSNFDLPHHDVTDVRDLVKLLHEREINPAVLSTRDAFSSIRDLVEGSDPLISRAVYNSIKSSEASVVSSVSVVASKEPWAFFCISRALLGTPMWVFFDGTDSAPSLDFSEISDHLRRVLPAGVQQRSLDETAGQLVSHFAHHLRRMESQLLPKRKQRILETFRDVLQKYEKIAISAKDAPRLNVIQELLADLSAVPQELVYDLDSLADAWGEYVVKARSTMRRTSRGAKIIRRKQVADYYLRNMIPTDQLEEIRNRVTLVRSADQRVVSAIVGVPRNH
jgi:superfamily II DNA or RNA helicase